MSFSNHEKMAYYRDIGHHEKPCPIFQGQGIGFQEIASGYRIPFGLLEVGYSLA